MKSASDKQRIDCNRFFNSRPPPPTVAELDCMRHLHLVADTFFEVQQQRHRADYDNSKQWTRSETVTLIAQVDSAFQSWRAIRDNPAAQSYLISLLGSPKGV
jgi:hypothetical protein